MNSKEQFLNLVSSELKIIRVENGDKQEELSKKSCVAPSTISKYENGSCSMNVDKIGQIIEPYNLDLNIFFTRVLAKTHKSSKNECL